MIQKTNRFLSAPHAQCNMGLALVVALVASPLEASSYFTLEYCEEEVGFGWDDYLSAQAEIERSQEAREEVERQSLSRCGNHFAQDIAYQVMGNLTSALAARNTTNMTTRSVTVDEIQEVLCQLGFDIGTIDGRWGPITQSAADEFLDLAGLEDDFGLDAYDYMGDARLIQMYEPSVEGRDAIARVPALRRFHEIERVLLQSNTYSQEALALSAELADLGATVWGDTGGRHLVALSQYARTLRLHGKWEEALAINLRAFSLASAEQGSFGPTTSLARNRLSQIRADMNATSLIETDLLPSICFTNLMQRHAEDEGYTLAPAPVRDRVEGELILAEVYLQEGRYPEIIGVVTQLDRNVASRETGVDYYVQGELLHGLALQGLEKHHEALIAFENVANIRLEEEDKDYNLLAGNLHLFLLPAYRAQSLLSLGASVSELEGELSSAVSLAEDVHGRSHPVTLQLRASYAAVVAKQSTDQALAIWEEAFDDLAHSYRRTQSVPLDLGAYLGLAAAQPASQDVLAARTFPAQGYLTYGELDVALGDMAARQQVGDATTAAALREFQDAREELQRLRRAYLVSFEADSGVGEEARERIQSEMRAADARFSEVAARVDRDFPALAELELPRALSADEAQALLAPGEGLLAYASLENHLYAWLVTQDGITWHRMDVPRADLAGRVAHLRASLDFNAGAPALPPAPGCELHAADPWMEDRPFDLCAARELHEIVLGQIDLSGIEELIVVPNGPLESLPFAMLVSDHTPGNIPRWLIEDHAIATLPTTSSLRALRQGEGAASGDDRLPFLGIAPVEFDSTSPNSALRGTPLAALPATADEVRLLSGLLGAGREGTMIGTDATEAFVKSAPLDRYRVLSFATHGLLSHEAGEVTEGAIREMALALRPGEGEDGFLTASEVAGLRLDADWVLLSACNTAGGDGDNAQGLSGLARAFFFAGARALMVSHWLIDDAVTPQIMADTMERSGTGDRLSRAQALRQAQLAMLSQRDHAHPFYWAPFSVVGENR